MTSWQDISSQVLRRDNCQCRSCGARPVGQIYHLVEPGDAGSEDPANLITLCGRCNMLAGSVPDWIVARVWKIQLKNIALERRMVRGRIKRKRERR